MTHSPFVDEVFAPLFKQRQERRDALQPLIDADAKGQAIILALPHGRFGQRTGHQLHNGIRSTGSRLHVHFIAANGIVRGLLYSP